MALTLQLEQLYHLLDLKQKQANFSEAMDARKQATDTAKQTKLAAKNSKVTADQLQIMTKQADETGRQGQTLMVFTVVTILFVRQPSPPAMSMSAVSKVTLDIDLQL